MRYNDSKILALRFSSHCNLMELVSHMYTAIIFTYVVSPMLLGLRQEQNLVLITNSLILKSTKQTYYIYVWYIYDRPAGYRSQLICWLQITVTQESLWLVTIFSQQYN